MMYNGVPAVCKKCKRTADATDFVLDVDYKMMVCPSCIKEKRMAKSASETQAMAQTEKQKQEEEQKARPAGWDKEDEYLEKAYKQRQKQKLTIEKVGDGIIMIVCPKCNYKFKYNIDRERPKNCTYCSEPVDEKALRYSLY
jgi:hypothetical protein